MDSPQNVISFCTGYGGLELGLRRAGVDIRPVCYIDREAYVQAVLVKEIEEGRLAPAPIWSDIATFDASIFRGKVDGVTCGYPCQPFSTAGKRLGEKDPRHLWLKIREHINTIGARWVFAENVYGHLSLGLPTVYSDLEEDGFKVEAGIFSAEECLDSKGKRAPHQRKRVFILGYMGDPKHDGLHEAQIRSRGDKNCDRSEKRKETPEQPKGTSGRKDLSNLQRAELAHPASRESWQSETGDRREGSSGGGQEILFPARPEEAQYDWEPPRTIIPELGRSPDGTDHRNDRLRLLGNGVFPPTAELAWKTLWRKIYER